MESQESFSSQEWNLGIPTHGCVGRRAEIERNILANQRSIRTSSMVTSPFMHSICAGGGKIEKTGCMKPHGTFSCILDQAQLRAFEMHQHFYTVHGSHSIKLPYIKALTILPASLGGEELFSSTDSPLQVS